MPFNPVLPVWACHTHFPSCYLPDASHLPASALSLVLAGTMAQDTHDSWTCILLWASIPQRPLRRVLMSLYHLPLCSLLCSSVKPAWRLKPIKGLMAFPEFPVLWDLRIMGEVLNNSDSPDISKAPDCSSLFSFFFSQLSTHVKTSSPYWNEFFKKHPLYEMLSVSPPQALQLQMIPREVQSVWFRPSLCLSIACVFFLSILF